MRRLFFLMVLAAALSFAATATATLPAVARLPYNTAHTRGCVANGHSYSQLFTLAGKSGYVTGSPASPINYSVNISPMMSGLTSTSDFNTANFTVGDQAQPEADWLQVGVTTGNSPYPTGWNPGNGTQWWSTWHLYVEYNNPSGLGYYFADVGPSNGTDTFTITQKTNGLFDASINGLVVYANANIPTTGGGRNSELDVEDYNGNNTVCDGVDGYFKQLNVNPNYKTFSNPPFYHCANTTGVNDPQHDWEGWDNNYGGYIHGPGPFEVWACGPG